MLEHALDRNTGILSVEPKAALTAQDFQAVASEVDGYLADHNNLTGLLLKAEHFPGWQSFAALIEHMKFVHDHHKRIARIAVLTDNALLTIPPHIASHFVAPEIKVFGASQTTDALAWLREGRF